MKTYLVLFRGINVGGHPLRPIKAPADILETLGATDVRTYIQRGNTVFRSGERTGAAQRIHLDPRAPLDHS